MKKINFKNLSSDEILTREELQKILGGNGSGKCLCECDNMKGNWYTDNCEGGQSWACGTPSGPYSCTEVDQ